MGSGSWPAWIATRLEAGLVSVLLFAHSGSPRRCSAEERSGGGGERRGVFIGRAYSSRSDGSRPGNPRPPLAFPRRPGLGSATRRNRSYVSTIGINHSLSGKGVHNGTGFDLAQRSSRWSTLAAGGLVAAPAALTQAATAVAPQRQRGHQSMIGAPFEEHDIVRVGADRPRQPRHGHAQRLGGRPRAAVTAVCDIRADRATPRADELGASSATPAPLEYGGSESSFQQLLRDPDVDLVYIATPWEFHYPQGVAALLGPASTSAWSCRSPPSSTSSGTSSTPRSRRRKHLWLMENCSYGRNELAMLKMAHEGVFGDVTNGHGGYLHDLRERCSSPTPTTPTPGAGSGTPAAPRASTRCTGWPRSPRAWTSTAATGWTTLAATSTAPRGLADYRERFIPPRPPVVARRPTSTATTSPA